MIPMPVHSSRYRKKFGQHFLNNTRIAKAIVEFADVENETVLEIGAGRGMLTRQITEKARNIFAVEIDTNLIKDLERIRTSNMVIINEDFLKLDLKNFENPVIIGNIPYSITRQILEKLIKEREYIKRVVLTVQKEYGQRILARVGSTFYGPITLRVNYFYNVVKGFAIPKIFFSPRPKVNSISIALTKRKFLFSLKDDESFFGFVSGIFRYRRKSLRSAITSYLHIVPKDIDHELLKKRPAHLSLNDFNQIYTSLQEQ